MKRMFVLANLRFLLPVLLIILVSACKNGGYQDGVWKGRSGEDDRGAFGEVSVTVKDGEIEGCQFLTWQKDGSVKDENYGKVNGEISNQDYYARAQLAVRAMEQYAEQYKTAKDINKVDIVSGATIAYDQFVEAVQNALEPAAKK